MDTIELSSTIDSYALINFKSIKLTNEPFSILPHDYRISFIFKQDQLQTAHQFTDFNYSFQENYVTFTEQQFTVPIKISSLRPDDQINIFIYQTDTLLAELEFQLFSLIDGFYYINNRPQILTSPSYCLKFDLKTQAKQVIFSDKHYERPQLQDVFLPSQHVQQLSDIQKIEIITQNISDQTLQDIRSLQQQIYINETMAHAPIKSCIVDSFMGDKIYPPKLQITSQLQQFDAFEITKQNLYVNQCENESKLSFYDNAEVTQDAITEAIDAFFNETNSLVSSTYNSLDYTYQYNQFEPHNFNFSKNVSNLSEQIMDQINQIIEQPYFNRVLSPLILIENVNFMIQNGNSFAYVIKSYLQLRIDLNIELFETYTDIPLEQLIYFLSSSFSDNTKLRKLVIFHLKKQDFQQLNQFIFQLTNCIQFDSNCELGEFLIQGLTGESLFQQFVQFPFYLQLWRDSQLSKSSKQKYNDLLALYFEKLQETSLEIYNQIQTSITFVKELYKLGMNVKQGNSDRPTQIQILGKELQCVNKYPLLLGKTDKVLFPFIKSQKKVIGINTEVYHVFKSFKMPLMIRLILEDNTECTVLLKFNDDVRNDVLVMQMFDFFDKTLQLNGLDLNSSLYGTFAFSPNFGIIECIQPSIDIDEIILDKKIQSIKTYFRQNQLFDSTEAQQIQTFIKSTALYSVMTYILAIGDRHSANIMVRPSGQLFHIDFGWLFNRDPKPYPPQMKISPEMIDTIGGIESPNFSTFVNYLLMSYKQIRVKTNLIFTLLFMLVGSGIQVVEEDSKNNFDWLQNRLHLSIPDEQINSLIIQLVSKQLNAVFPRVIDTLHRFVQQQRK